MTKTSHTKCSFCITNTALSTLLSICLLRYLLIMKITRKVHKESQAYKQIKESDKIAGRNKGKQYNQ